MAAELEESDLIAEATRSLERPLVLAHQASSVASTLFRLRTATPVRIEIVALIETFKRRVRESGLEDVLNNQLSYAATLGASSHRLSYEELHKLLSLCDEIHALQGLGFRASPEALRHFEANVRERFTRQRPEARMAAEDRVNDFVRNHWWYAELLGKP